MPDRPPSTLYGPDGRRLESSGARLTRSQARTRALSIVDRQRYAKDVGLTFGGLRDMECALGYQATLTYSDYAHRYHRGGVAARLVEAYPEATWMQGPAIVEDASPEVETEFELQAAELVDRLELWSRYQRADTMAGIGEYAVLLIGADGELDTPLPRMASEADVLYVTPVPQDRALIESFVEATQDPRFGLPEFYQLTLGSLSTTTTTARTPRQQITKRVHWSRVVHVADGLMEDDTFGTPRLRAVWNYLDDLMKVEGGGAEASWKRAQPWLQLNMDAAVEMSDDDQDAMDEEVDELIHGLRTVFRTQGVEANLLAAAVGAFGGNVDAIVGLISATTKIPQRILTGSERGELSSTQDRNNWSERVSARNQRFGTRVVRDLFDRLILHGALPEPPQYEPVWPEIEELNEAEKATVSNTLASANKTQFEAEGVVIVTASEIRDNVLGLAPLDEQDARPTAIEALRATKRRLARRKRRLAEFVDVPPAGDPDWRAVHRAADANRAAIERAVEDMLLAARDAVNERQLEAALATGDNAALERVITNAVLAAGAAGDEAIADALLKTLTDGGTATAAAAKARGSWLDEAAPEEERPQ